MYQLTVTLLPLHVLFTVSCMKQLYSTWMLLIGISGTTTSHFQNTYKEFENHVTHCEYLSLRIASKICDLFNAPIDSEDWNERIHQDSIIEHLGFAPWLSNGIAYSNGKTLQGIRMYYFYRITHIALLH